MIGSLNNKNTKGLRFCPIVRVSTEKQERKGQSLETQKSEIKQYVKFLGGVIPPECWQFSGQEHATGIEEREKLDKILMASDKNMFDATVTCDPQRWARNNHKNKEGLVILRSNGIRFFVCTTEHDLYDPLHIFLISMAVEMGEFQANQGALKSILNRIEKAKKGLPACRLPFGRTFDDVKGLYGSDKEKKAMVEDWRDRVFRGETFTSIGERYGISRNTIRDILCNRCGGIWEQKFDVPRFNIHNIVIKTNIPPLLPTQDIEKIRKFVKERRTTHHMHGNIKYTYPLSRMIFCGHCGQVLSGEKMSGRTRSYRHPKWLNRRGQKIPFECDRQFSFVNAEVIEDALLVHLFSIFGDLPKLEKAAREALPEREERKRLEQIAKRLKNERLDLKRAIKNLVNAIQDGRYSENIANRLEKQEARYSKIEREMIEVQDQITAIPSEEDIKKSAILSRNIYKMYLKSMKHLRKMSLDDRRKFFQAVFDGKDKKGNRLGVYVKKDNRHPEQIWFYEVRGVMGTEFGRLPMPVDEMQARFGIHGQCDPGFNPLKHDSPWFPNDNKLTTENNRMYCRGDCPGVLSGYSPRNHIKRQKKIARVVFGYHR